MQEQGTQQEAEEGPGSAVQGSYSYTDADGKVITITYTADANGFRAMGDHLPTAPPIPPEILQSLEQNAAEEAAGGGGGGNGGGGGRGEVKTEVSLSDSNIGSWAINSEVYHEKPLNTVHHVLL